MKKNILFLSMYIGIIGLFLYKTVESNSITEGFPIDVLGNYPDKAIANSYEIKAGNIKKERSMATIVPNALELSKDELIDEAELLLSDNDPLKNSDGLFILNSLAVANDARANYLLAQLYEKGARVPKDADKALSFYKVAALNGSDDANIYIFNHYLDNELTTKAHYQEALVWFQEVSETNRNPIAYYGLAYMYEIGLGVDPDQTKAIEYYRESAQSNFVLAYERLANLYLLTNEPKNVEEALLLFQRGANADIPTAQFKLGYMYEEGLGTRQDTETARFWYQKAANHGLSIALVALGNLYAEGRNVEKDNQRAYEYYRVAAEKGDVIAQSLVARSFERGIGIEKNIDRALFWYTKAAEQNDATAQYNLGRILEEYEEIRNLEDAKKWYTQAEKSGVAEAKTALERLAK